MNVFREKLLTFVYVSVADIPVTAIRKPPDIFALKNSISYKYADSLGATNLIYTAHWGWSQQNAKPILLNKLEWGYRLADRGVNMRVILL